jgi:serine/threonine-protein kinase
MQTTDQLNTALAGRYSVERLIGEGGMATVYLARDVRHQRRVALKVLKPDLGAIVGVERFLSEIQVTANLQHPNLLPLFDSGAADSLLFYVMPYVEGESLRARLDREKQLPVDEAVHIATAVASALDYAHRHGVIHRDLKPENILLHEGQPLVADFGIALALSNAGGARVTQTGISLGTPQYMSPEQATGDRTVDARSDIYSLGALAYEMLAGEPPHTGPTAQAIIAKLLTEIPREPRALRPRIPAHVDRAVLRALEKLPADRFDTAGEFARALNNPSAAPDVASLYRGSHEGDRRRWITWGVLAVSALLVVLAALVLPRRGTPIAGSPTRLPLHLTNAVRFGIGSPAAVALSPDGERIAAVMSGRIALIDLSDPVERAIPGTEGGSGPVFSMDGSELAFNRAGVLYRVVLNGGAPTPVADSASQPAWGDRGTFFFVRKRSYWALRAGETRASHLVATDSVGLLRRSIVLPGERFAIADVMRADRTTGALVSVDLSSGRIDSLGITGTTPRYSPTGHLVYLDSTRAVVAVPFSVRTRRATGPPVVILRDVETGYFGGAHYAISQRGSLIAIPDNGASQMQLTIVSAAEGPRAVTSELRSYGWMRLSPDGRRAAFEIFEDDTRQYNIWSMDLASGILTRVSRAGTAIRAQGWTPDSRSVFLLKAVTTSGGVVQVQAADGTGQPRDVAMFPRGVLHGSVDATGRLIVVRSGNTISLARLDSASPARVLFEDSTAGASPSISPDGKYIAYTSEESGRSEVYVRVIDGQGLARVSVNGGTQPLWDRAGTSLFYRDDNAAWRAWLSRAPSLAVTKRDSLFPAEEYAGGGMTWAVFPDDKRFLMLLDRSTPSYPVLVQNWPRM